jgi:hypothetical protein
MARLIVRSATGSGIDPETGFLQEVYPCGV